MSKRKKSVFRLVVEFDDEKTDAESVATLLDRLLLHLRETDVMAAAEKDYGEIRVGEVCPSTDNPEDPNALDMIIDHEDTAQDREESIRLRVRQEGSAVDITLLGRTKAGTPDRDRIDVAIVALDYHDNVIKCMGYNQANCFQDDGAEDPAVNVDLVPDVEEALKKPRGW